MREYPRTFGRRLAALERAIRVDETRAMREIREVEPSRHWRSTERRRTQPDLVAESSYVEVESTFENRNRLERSVRGRGQSNRVAYRPTVGQGNSAPSSWLKRLGRSSVDDTVSNDRRTTTIRSWLDRVVRATLTAPVYSYRVYVYSLRGMVSSSSSSSSTLVNGSRCARRLVKIRFRADYADREEERTANCELRVDDRRTRPAARRWSEMSSGVGRRRAYAATKKRGARQRPAKADERTRAPTPTRISKLTATRRP
ncbi:hypothetical protein V9T40_007415 [Parthenolecanium corni]|uniref:Uncharacterized protein n=1 Tax=Parthenolecanium corni TaxID=536013 RepID=A0AAN9TV99_9HEMI